MKPSHVRRKRLAFTLVELLVVIGIIGLLAGLASPAFSSAILKAKSIQCSAHLRAIGVSVTQAATDNNNCYPPIDQAAAPIYSPAGSVQGLVGVLGPYGISTNDVQCPVDLASGASSSFQKYGSSYEWNPVFDDENTVTPILYLNANTQIPVSSSRVRLCTDFLGLHRGKMNALYGDGHVTAR